MRLCDGIASSNRRWSDGFFWGGGVMDSGKANGVEAQWMLERLMGQKRDECWEG